MWWIVLSVVLLGAWIAFCVYMARTQDDSLDGGMWILCGAVLGSFGWAMLLFLLSLFIIPATTGLDEDYTEGEIVGHVTEVARQGIIWKTNEIWLAVAVEDGLAFQFPRKGSVPDPLLWNMLAQDIGRKVRLRYKGWLVMPFRLGATRYEIIEAEWLE